MTSCRYACASRTSAFPPICSVTASASRVRTQLRVFLERCPEGAYGICDSARSEGVAYRQSIHYYSEPDDRPLLQTWCEQFNDGQWRTPDSE